ncbi:MAG: 5-formyltetrahydrofolate cyclo-ligase [Povalibacter sp.]
MSSSTAHQSSIPDTERSGDRQLSREELRRKMKAIRRSVSLVEQRHVAEQLAIWISRSRLLRTGSRVGVYLPQGREADLSIAIKRAHERGCRLYLPFITHMRTHRMQFVEFVPGSPLKKNAYGILEPIASHAARVSIRRLDVVLLPLVAVDARGWRLGNGAGFYDRHLSHLRASRRWRRPKLIGIAYEFQRVPHLEPSKWDVPIEGLITERGFHTLRPWAPPRDVTT